MPADFVEREAFGGDADAGEDSFRRAQLAGLTLDIGLEEESRGLVVHGADEIDAVRPEPVRPVLGDGLAGDVEVGEDGDGDFRGGAGGLDGLCAFGDERRNDRLAEGEPFVAERPCAQDVGRPVGELMLDVVFEI